MKKARTVIVWCWILLLVAVFVWWATYIPHTPERMFKAIPARATLVSRHHRLAARWERLHTNPLILSGFLAAGIRPSTVSAWAKDPVARKWFERLAGEDMLVAYLPPRISHEDPTWVVVSWLGRRARWLRWQLAWQRPREFSAPRAYHGHAYWRVETDDIPPGTVLCVALTDGIAIGCYGSSEDRLLELLDTLDGLRPSITYRLSDPVFRPAQRSPDVPDMAWCSWRLPFGLGGTLGFEFSDISATTFICRTIIPESGLELSSQTNEWARTLRANGVIASLSWPLQWQKSFPSPAAVRVFWRSLLRIAEQQNAPGIVFQVLDGSYATRVAGIRIPALVIGVPLLKEPAECDAQIRAMLDEINAETQWGLVPATWTQMNGQTIVVIEGTQDNFYAKLPLAGKPGYAVVDSWLYVAMQAEVLERWLSEKVSERPCWLDRNSISSPCWFWCSLNRGNDMLKLGLSAYSLYLMVTEGDSSRALRARIRDWKDWLDTFAPFEECRITVFHDPSLRADVVGLEMKRVCP